MVAEKTLRRRFRDERLLRSAEKELPHWSVFDLVTAYKARLERCPTASFNDILWECGYEQSRRHETLGGALLWHVSKLRHRAHILEHGFFHHKGTFFAPARHGLPFMLAAGLTREEREDPSRLVLFGCLIDTETYQAGRHYEESRCQWRFFSRVSPDTIEWVLEDQRIDLIGEPLKRKGCVPRVTFRRDGKKWRAPGRNKVPFLDRGEFSTPEEFLDLYVDFLFDRHTRLSVFEILNGAHATIQPGEALPLDLIVAHLARACRAVGKCRNQQLLAREPVARCPET